MRALAGSILFLAASVALAGGLIAQALDKSGGVRTQAARLLGVTLRSLRYRLQKHALGDAGDDVPDSEETPS